VDHCEKAKIDRDSSFGVQGDVASILARRMAVEMSDSEDGGHGNSGEECSYTFLNVSKLLPKTHIFHYSNKKK
jgi:hypothetical protein